MSNEPGPAPARKSKIRYRRQLRSRIILAFVLLGFGLTALFAYATNLTRSRVENTLVEDVMNRNIDEFARRYFAHPTRSPDLPVQQMFALVVKSKDFEQLRLEQPDWHALGDGTPRFDGFNPHRTDGGEGTSG